MRWVPQFTVSRQAAIWTDEFQDSRVKYQVHIEFGAVEPGGYTVWNLSRRWHRRWPQHHSPNFTTGHTKASVLCEG